MGQLDLHRRTNRRGRRFEDVRDVHTYVSRFFSLLFLLSFHLSSCLLVIVIGFCDTSCIFSPFFLTFSSRLNPVGSLADCINDGCLDTHGSYFCSLVHLTHILF